MLLFVAATGGRVLATPKDVPQVDEFVAHLEELLPPLLRGTAAPGAVVALIEDGELAYRGAFGFANADDAVPMTVDHVFNVGSISKTLTAWGVMRLVESGLLDLDEPVRQVIPELFADDPRAEGITVRRLLSHTAGLSLSAVPEYGPDDPTPTLEDALRDVQLTEHPGTAWAYSGGGYMVLQYLVEKLSGKPFAHYMSESVLQPLGMSDSSFEWSASNRDRWATGYDGEGIVSPRYRYVGQSAASLNSTAGDLCRFLIAGLGDEVPDPVLQPASIHLMQSPAPHALQRFGLRYGLGYDIWNLAEGKLLVGHNGQNTGWASATWLSPEDRAGIVILTNHSDGMDLWRWILCDWVKWREDTMWRGLCTDRPEFLPAATAFWKTR